MTCRAYAWNDGWAASFSATALAAIDMHQRAALGEREDRLVDRAAARSARQRIMPPRGPRSTLWVVKHTTSAYGTGTGSPAGDQPDEVGGVDHELGADLVGDLPERGEVDQPRVRRGASR